MDDDVEMFKPWLDPIALASAFHVRENCFFIDGFWRYDEPQFDMQPEQSF